MPAVVAVGLAFGATASTAAVVGTAVIATGASVAATGVSMYEQNKAAKNAARVDTSAAAYNARYDESMAQQLDMDTLQNVRTARANNATYLSKQATSYAAAGVDATSGSPLAAQIANAGKMEQNVQQQYLNSQQQQQAYYSKAKVGILQGDAQAYADRMSGTLALINGGVKLARTAWGGYESGIFAGGGGGGGGSTGPLGGDDGP